MISAASRAVGILMTFHSLKIAVRKIYLLPETRSSDFFKKNQEMLEPESVLDHAVRLLQSFQNWWYAHHISILGRSVFNIGDFQVT